MSPMKMTSSPELATVDVVLTDVDDTLTRQGRLSSATLAAIERLSEAGVAVVPVTGGCAGWCDHIVRAWPVAAVIGESGAFRLKRAAGGGLDCHSVRPLTVLRDEQRRPLAIAERAMQTVPGANLAADQPYRLADVAVDHAQDVPPLAADQVERLLITFQAAGARARAPAAWKVISRRST